MEDRLLTLDPVSNPAAEEVDLPVTQGTGSGARGLLVVQIRDVIKDGDVSLTAQRPLDVSNGLA